MSMTLVEMKETSPSNAEEDTEVGSYFVANYPPFSIWTKHDVERAAAPALQTASSGVPLGLYLHIPFCRKRCHFCYFRVYTDKNADEIENYLDTLVRELELYAKLPAVAGRPLNFVYFGGGTPSFLSTRQLGSLVSRLRAIIPWDEAEEITFECEPGTLTETKLSAIRDMGVTRLSLGVENFDDHILEVNGRAHRSQEIFRSFEFARSIGFPQINIDLIAGMLGESDDNWRKCVEATLKLAPDSVTIYQMELPFNTVYSKDILGGVIETPVADWPTKRAWVDYAFSTLAEAGYQDSSAYTMVKDKTNGKFAYRDCLWHGADMFGTGVASFGHVNGVHMQNLDTWETYSAAIRRDELPLSRAYKPTDEERMIRELVLQLKRGWVRPAYFTEKYGVNILERFQPALASLAADGHLDVANAEMVQFTREALLRVDTLLVRFFKPEHAGIRYT
jgi:oxygen-independent coproporphyrinogen-3 oxidase